MFEQLTSQFNAPEQRVPFDKDAGLAIIYNPTNPKAFEHADSLRQYVGEIWPGKNGKPRVVYAESQPTVEASMEFLAELEQEGFTHYSIHGGDGTYSKVLLAAANLESEGIFVTSADGNACDLPHAVHTVFFKNNPLDALRYGSIGKIRPIDINIETLDGETSQFQAINYFGIGLSGVVARRLNSPEYRQAVDGLSRAERLRLEAKLVWQEAGAMQPFHVLNDDGSEATTERQIIEHSFLGIPHMAKMRFGSKNIVFSPKAIVGELASRQLSDLTRGLGGAALGLTKIHSGEEDRLRVYAEDQDYMFAQVDGDLLLIPNGSIITIRKRSDPIVNLVHTKLIRKN